MKNAAVSIQLKDWRITPDTVNLTISLHGSLETEEGKVVFHDPIEVNVEVETEEYEGDQRDEQDDQAEREVQAQSIHRLTPTPSSDPRQSRPA